MQIVIPMSGYGERFRRAGYAAPKPLIEVDGKPIVAHVIDMFPGETKFIFICNREHLAEPTYQMADTLRRYCPTGQIVPIAPHKLGPVNAVLLARSALDPSLPTIVNYCDFTCYWSWPDFRAFVKESDSDGCVPAYRGFHPHSLGSTFYAYMKHDGLWMDDIQEKQPWTDDPPSEFASSGTYYFRTGALCLEMFEQQVAQDLSVNGEYYASLAYKVLKQRDGRISIYELQHFMQWGTPADLEEYVGWSKVFRRLAVDDATRPRHGGAVLLPMAGLGKRFSDEGYAQPKPLIDVSGRAMVIQATRDLPETPRTKFVLRQDLPGLDQIQKKLMTSFVGAELQVLEKLTEGQAITCQIGAEDLDPDQPVTIGACDNGMLYDARALEALMEEGGPDVLVWVVRGHVDGRLRPKMFGWVVADEHGAVSDVLVKAAPSDPATAPMIVGAFTFRRAADFSACADALVARDGRVNGEFYVDSLIKDAVDRGLDCRLFEIAHYIGWGTPNDLRTFQYWQSCFDKWKTHPYRLEKDRRVPPARVEELRAQYAARLPARPRGVASAMPAFASQEGARRTLGEGVRFLPVGVLAVATDYIVYLLLLAAGLAHTPAKVASFIAGAGFAFFGNRFFTFKRSAGATGVLAFVAVYLVSLVLNAGTNAAVLGLLDGTTWRTQVGFLAATGVSAATNFIGMKLLVFRGASAVR